MTRVTRSSNAIARPGQVDAPRKRRTKAEIEAEKREKEAAKAEKAQAKARKEQGIAEIEHNKPLARPDASGEAEGAPAAKSSSAKRKRAHDEEPVAASVKSSKAQNTYEEAYSGSEPPTPPPSAKKSSSELSEAEGGESAGEVEDEEEADTEADETIVLSTPQPTRKKARKEEKIPLRESVAAAKRQLAVADDPVLAAGMQSERPAPSAGTATSQPRVSAWAARVVSAGLLTPTANKVQPISHHRTAGVTATPFMKATSGDKTSNSGAEEKAGTKPRPKPRKKGQAAGAAEDGKKTPSGDAVITVKQEPLSDAGEVDGGGFAKTDDESAEATAAKASPVKNGARLTSSGIVKTEDVNLATPGKSKKQRKQAAKKADAPKKTKAAPSSSVVGSSRDKAIELDDDEDVVSIATTKPRATVKNSDLPEGAHEQNMWRAKFLPTFLKAIGASEDPWSMSDKQAVKLLQLVWNVVYSSSEALSSYKVEENDAVHSVATQRLYEWRSAFGSAAVRSYEAFFNSYPAEFPGAESRRDFCTKILPAARLFYQEPEGTKKDGLYRSPFVLAGMVVHIDAIQGAVDVPELNTSRTNAYPYAAIGLAAAAAYRVAALWHLQRLALDQKGNVIVLKTLNRVTGKMSTKESDFSHANFSNKTQQCMTSAKKLPLEDIDEIIAAAYRMAQLPPPSAPAGAPAALALDFDFDFGELTQD